MKHTRCAWRMMVRLCIASVISICGVSAFGQSQLPPGLFRLPAPAGPSVGPFAPDPALSWSQLSDGSNWTPSREVSDLLERLVSGEVLLRSELDGSLPLEQLERLNPYLLPSDDVSVSVPEHGDARNAATEIAPSEDTSISGFLTRGDVDYFRIYVQVAGTLTVWTSGEIDTVGVLLDQRGQAIDSNDDESSSSVNFRIVANAVSPGEYFVRVTPYDANAVGFYQIKSSVREK